MPKRTVDPSERITAHCITAGDGHHFELICAGESAGRPLIFVPALGVDARYYRRFAGALARVGFYACVMELRGRQTSSVRPVRGATYGYAEILEHDVVAVVEHVAAATGQTPIVAGHSLGGQLALLGGARCGAERVAVVASGLPFHRAWGTLGSIGMIAISHLIDGIATALGVYPGERLGFGARDSARLMGDWTRTIRTGTYDVRGSEIDWEAALREYDRPALAIRIEGDRWAPARSVEMLMAKLQSADVVHRTVQVAGDGHPHFAWVKQHDAVVEQLASFAEL